MRHPTCIWHQDRCSVYVTLDHPHLRIDSAHVSEGTLHLAGCGVEGETYGAALPLRGAVSGCTVQTSSRHRPCIVLHKRCADVVPPSDNITATEPTTPQHTPEDDNVSLSSLSSLSSEEEDEDDSKEWRWDHLLAPGCKNRCVVTDWSRWKGESEPLGKRGELDMSALQGMLETSSC